MDVWAEILKETPYIAIILALGIVCIVLYRSREKLQSEYRENLVQATQALQDLTAEYLKQTFADSAAWQEQYRELAESFKDQTKACSDEHRRVEDKVGALTGEIDKHETRMKEFVKDYVSQRIDRAVDDIKRSSR